MKTGVALLASSMAFSSVIAIAYWLSAHEPAGTILLGLMAAGLAFAAGYALLAERGARAEGDFQEVPRGKFAGDDLGVFTVRSPWPILTAACIALTLGGLLWWPFIFAVALVGLLLCLLFMGFESNRV